MVCRQLVASRSGSAVQQRSQAFALPRLLSSLPVEAPQGICRHEQNGCSASRTFWSSAGMQSAMLTAIASGQPAGSSSPSQAESTRSFHMSRKPGPMSDSRTHEWRRTSPCRHRSAAASRSSHAGPDPGAAPSRVETPNVLRQREAQVLRSDTGSAIECLAAGPELVA